MWQVEQDQLCQARAKSGGLASFTNKSFIIIIYSKMIVDILGMHISAQNPFAQIQYSVGG